MKHILWITGFLIAVPLLTYCAPKQIQQSTAKPITENKQIRLVNKPHGLYVVRSKKREMQLPINAFSNPNIEGLFLRYVWKDIQPNENKFDWTDLDADFEKAVQNGKKVELGILAGEDTPEWIYQKGVRKLHFVEATRNFYGKCETYDLPTFWDEQFKTSWKNFIGELATHLRSKPGFMESITLIKLSGINSKSDETKLPQEVNIDKGDCHTGDHRAIWSHAGFKPSLLINTWKEFADVIDQSFPAQYIGLALVMPKTSFPDVDETGKLTNENNMHQQILDAALQKFPNRLAVNSTALRAEQGTPPFVDQMYKKGAVVGYQLYGQYINPPCAETKTCDQSEMTKVLENGINHHADFIEIFLRDLRGYPEAVTNAKKQYDNTIQ
jgi:hypothetical protein